MSESWWKHAKPVLFVIQCLKGILKDYEVVRFVRIEYVVASKTVFQETAWKISGKVSKCQMLKDISGRRPVKVFKSVSKSIHGSGSE